MVFPIGSKTPDMRICHQDISETTGNIENNRYLRLEDEDPAFQNYSRYVGRHKRLDDPNLHVNDWRTGLRHVYGILQPGGILLFEYTNKFSRFRYPLLRRAFRDAGFRAILTFVETTNFICVK